MRWECWGSPRSTVHCLSPQITISTHSPLSSSSRLCLCPVIEWPGNRSENVVRDHISATGVVLYILEDGRIRFHLDRYWAPKVVEGCGLECLHELWVNQSGKNSEWRIELRVRNSRGSRTPWHGSTRARMVSQCSREVQKSTEVDWEEAKWEDWFLWINLSWWSGPRGISVSVLIYVGLLKKICF